MTVSVQAVIDEIIDRAYYVTGKGGPEEVRYISINEHALSAALHSALYGRDRVMSPEFRAAVQLIPRHRSYLPGAESQVAPDPEAPEHCIPGPGCRHGR